MLQAGERIDEWIVDGPLGAGGTASVYRCHNAQAVRIRAALKVLDPGALTRPDARSRLAREGEVLHGLDHPSIVRVHGVRAEAAPPYLVMELVEGERLSNQVQRVGPRSAEDAMPVLDALADAVAYLHHRGIQHRDIKPQNVLLRPDGVPVLVDFGLVLEAGASRLTADGLRMGTVSYVPPEWSDPKRIDPVKWDVYSLGAVFWEVLVGRRAFPLPDDQSPTQAALQVMRDKRGHPPLDPGPDVPFFLRVLVRDMTHADPDRRPKDATEVLARLREGATGAMTDPVDLFQTPMPAWQAEPSSPTLDALASSEIPMATRVVEGQGSTSDWWRSFVIGLFFGALLVALTFSAIGVGWFLGRGSATPMVVEPPTPLPVAPEPAPVTPAAPAPFDRPPEAPAPPAPAPAAPAAPSPAPAADGPARVSASAYAAWVAQRPDWQRDAAIAAGLADAGYLKGWDAQVPAGAATRVSFYAATAYCESRGGLLAVDAEPTRWPSDQTPYMEWRIDGGSPAWRTGDGRTGSASDPLQSSFGTGFRCSRP